MPTLAEGIAAACQALLRQGWEIVHEGVDFVIAYVPPAKRMMPEPSIVEAADLVVTAEGLADGSALRRYQGFVLWKCRGHAEGRRIFSVYFPTGTDPAQQCLFREATTHVLYPQLPPPNLWAAAPGPPLPKLEVKVPKRGRRSTARRRGGRC